MRDLNSSAAATTRRSLIRSAGLLVVAGIVTSMTLTACSSSSSTSGAGLSVSGLWRGVMRSNATNQTFPLTVQLIQSEFASDAGQVTSTLSGTASVGRNANDCVVGGSITGSTAGSNISMMFADSSFSGSINSDGVMQGLWSRTSTVPSTTTTDGSTDGDDSGEDDPEDDSDEPTTSRGVIFAACTATDSGNFALE